MSHISAGFLESPWPIGNKIRNFLADHSQSIIDALARRRRYRKAVFELSNCTDRELHDMGISRCDIRRLARESLDHKTPNRR